MTKVNWKVIRTMKTDSDDRTGVVLFVDWECSVEVDGEIVSTLPGSTALVPPTEDQTFIEESDLTDEILLDWVFNKEYFDKDFFERRAKSFAGL